MCESWTDKVIVQFLLLYFFQLMFKYDPFLQLHGDLRNKLF